MTVIIREYKETDISAMIEIWNEVVESGNAFPQLDLLTQENGACFFAGQSCAMVAEVADKVVGLYILHPNNVGRCGHIANASYAVKAAERGNKIGEELVAHSIIKGANLGFRILQFNAVVASNDRALQLYKQLGFVTVGRIPEGFLMKDGHYEDIVLFYKIL